jgi:hypothetical protein
MLWLPKAIAAPEVNFVLWPSTISWRLDFEIYYTANNAEELAGL